MRNLLILSPQSAIGFNNEQHFACIGSITRHLNQRASRRQGKARYKGSSSFPTTAAASSTTVES